jgi:hypothetical protein
MWGDPGGVAALGIGHPALGPATGLPSQIASLVGVDRSI